MIRLYSLNLLPSKNDYCNKQYTHDSTQEECEQQCKAVVGDDQAPAPFRKQSLRFLSHEVLQRTFFPTFFTLLVSSSGVKTFAVVEALVCYIGIGVVRRYTIILCIVNTIVIAGTSTSTITCSVSTWCRSKTYVHTVASSRRI